MLNFSVLTPTLNQAAYIGKTIQSVLDQNYPDFEHVVIDGGSTDGTVEILKKYPHLDWVSEKDKGRADALNKGFALAEGDVIAWVNSDDYYLPETFLKVAGFFERNPDAQIVVGRARVVNAEGRFLFDQDAYPENQLHFEGLLKFWKNKTLPQPSIFFKREALLAVGLFNPALHDYPDYDLVLRLSQKFKIYSVPDFFSAICIQDDAGSVIDIKNGVLERKLLEVSRPHWKKLPFLKRVQINVLHALWSPMIWMRARYESFALRHKDQLKRAWREKKSTRSFLYENRALWRKYPAESFFAVIHFLVKTENEGLR